MMFIEGVKIHIVHVANLHVVHAFNMRIQYNARILAYHDITKNQSVYLLVT